MVDYIFLQNMNFLNFFSSNSSMPPHHLRQLAPLAAFLHIDLPPRLQPHPAAAGAPAAAPRRSAAWAARRADALLAAAVGNAAAVRPAGGCRAPWRQLGPALELHAVLVQVVATGTQSNWLALLSLSLPPSRSPSTPTGPGVCGKGARGGQGGSDTRPCWTAPLPGLWTNGPSRSHPFLPCLETGGPSLAEDRPLCSSSLY